MEPLLPPSQDTEAAPLHDDAPGEKIHGGITRQWSQAEIAAMRRSGVNAFEEAIVAAS